LQSVKIQYCNTICQYY